MCGDSVKCCHSVCTQVAIIGFWEDLVRCDELLSSVDKGGRGVGGGLFFRVRQSKLTTTVNLVTLQS